MRRVFACCGVLGFLICCFEIVAFVDAWLRPSKLIMSPPPILKVNLERKPVIKTGPFKVGDYVRVKGIRGWWVIELDVNSMYWAYRENKDGSIERIRFPKECFYQEE